MPARLTVVVSQGQSQNPAKRQLEEDIVTQLLMEPGIDAIVVPHLYDLTADSTGVLALQSVSGPLVVCAWLFPRAAMWTLDRNQIRGMVGTTQLVGDEPGDDDEEEEEIDEQSAAEEKARVVDQRTLPNRRIYCLDLRVSNRADDFVAEVRRIRDENRMQVVGISTSLNRQQNGQQNGQLNSQQNGQHSNGQQNGHASANPSANGDTAHAADGPGTVRRVEEDSQRRWYPVIDYSRCTNCMECIDFCLFGVYGVDKIDTILVEQPDNCRKGCPACSRVCPENAIIFPQHKTPAIAGSPEIGASLKIDLSELFGAPEQQKSAEDVAIAERDEQLMLAGRDTVGDSVGIRRDRKSDDSPGAKDELDQLMDQLDALDL